MTVRLVALGDSVTVGMGDPLPGGGWRGWAALLAGALGPEGEVEFSNLADCGATAVDLAADQLPRALALRPTLASVLAGVNDTLRGRFDLAAIAAALEEVVGGLRGAGATVLTARLPDPGLMLGIPDFVRRPLTRRVHGINAVLDHLADRYETVHIDLGSNPALYERRMWGVDRLHPSERGHRLLARLFAAGLAEHGFAGHAPPSAEPVGREPSAWASARWMAVEGTGWIARRSRDFLPQFCGLVLSEAWHEVRGRTGTLDEVLHAELDVILRRLGAPGPGGSAPAAAGA
ncbi:SGNH/GDSL hydrolase family protein [Sphaerisporangium album]|uniref:SGNH/GDSL hydrolase family protein n=1 Tax=Sphaerisporangium album TaxID=509200 RepID=A0A367FQV7_9ACTN|nr:SGNH/GDSL hydrolase family protein [Sphaerisporangium album]RCG32758.1 SGNH/GDSL hydrolase family protein [Sphaerisporangium album]